MLQPQHAMEDDGRHAQPSDGLVDGRSTGLRVGERAPRGCCTDLLFLLLWLAAAVGFGVVATLAWDRGNPLRVMYGTDYLGNVCGRTGARNAPRLPANVTEAEWRTRNRLWFPFGETDDWRSAFKLGVCVAECPHKGDVVHVYPNPSNATTGLPDSFGVQYNSDSYLRRCLPNDNNTAVIDELHDIVDAFDISGLLLESVAEIADAEQTLYYSLGVVLGGSVVWLLLVYCMAVPMLIATVLAILAAFAYVGKLSLDHADELNAGGNDDARWFKALAYVAWALGGLFAMVVLCMARRLKDGTDVVRYSARLLLANPMIVLLPVINACLLVGWIVLAALTALNIQTMAHQNETSPFHWAGGDIAGVIEEVPDDKQYLHIYNLVFFLWTAMFIVDLHYLCTSLVASFWYWEADIFCGSPLVAIKTAVAHHLGTVAFGSAVIALCKLLRWVLTKVEKLAISVVGGGERLEGALSVVCCCVCCLEKCLKFITDKAYCVTAVEGRSFCSAGGRAMELIACNCAATAVTETVATVMTFLGKLLIVAGTGVFAYFCLDRWDVSPAVEHEWQPVVFVLVMAYLIASVFVDMFGTVVDTVMISTFIDRDLHVDPRYGRDIRQHMRI